VDHNDEDRPPRWYSWYSWDSPIGLGLLVLMVCLGAAAILLALR
jgi:hypothetical protein